MSSATSSQGVTLKRGNSTSGASSTYTLIAEVTNITGPTSTKKPIEVSSVDSTAAEFISGLLDNGEITFEMNFVGGNAQHQGIDSDMVAGTLRDWQLTLADMPSGGSQNSRCTFTGLVVARDIKMAVNDKVKSSVTIKITGAVTRVYAV